MPKKKKQPEAPTIDEQIEAVTDDVTRAVITNAVAEAQDVIDAVEEVKKQLTSGETPVLDEIEKQIEELDDAIDDLETDLEAGTAVDTRQITAHAEYNWRDIQRRLKNLGFYKSTVDGIRGPLTNAAIIKFKQSIGYKARDYYGPLTHKALMGTRLALPQVREHRGENPEDLPWMAELEMRMGWHERSDNAELKEWLKEGTVGVDPAKIPWCGDLVETAIYSTLPAEPKFANPLLARNWMNFGKECKPQYGSIGVFWRGSRDGWKGHVAFLIGFDPVRNRYRMRGGNQSNMLRDDWIDADRLLGSRWPISYPETNIPLPHLNSKGERVSQNEA